MNTGYPVSLLSPPPPPTPSLPSPPPPFFSFYSSISPFSSLLSLTQANALKDTRAVRVLLDVAINAPLIKIPYSSKADSGTLQVDLGVFRIQNRFFHGYETAQTRGSVVDIGTAQAILDRISVECSSLQVYRCVCARVCVCVCVCACVCDTPYIVCCSDDDRKHFFSML